MIWINYIFRVPIAAICTIFVGIILLSCMAVYAVFVDWQKGWEGLGGTPKDAKDFFKPIAGIK